MDMREFAVQFIFGALNQLEVVQNLLKAPLQGVNLTIPTQLQGFFALRQSIKLLFQIADGVRFIVSLVAVGKYSKFYKCDLQATRHVRRLGVFPQIERDGTVEVFRDFSIRPWPGIEKRNAVMALVVTLQHGLVFRISGSLISIQF